MNMTDHRRPNREYKSRVFIQVFENKQDLLDLYNALHGTHYTNVEDLEINTLDDTIYLGMKNDVSFILDKEMSLYEHQSTLNPNMPLRGFLYLGEEYRSYLSSHQIYDKKLVMVPTPEYIVFYNGEDEIGEETTLWFSDAFLNGKDNACMEFKARVLNINYGHNKEILKKCQKLQEYAIFIEMIRTYSKTMTINQAINTAIDECIEKGVLQEFLRKRRDAVMSSLLTEYDEEKVRKMWHDEDKAEGIAEGMAKGMAIGIAEGKTMGIAEGKTMGRAEDRDLISRLIQALLADNRLEDLERFAKDQDYQEQLLKEYGIN